jgi:hypothetical protein
MGKKPSLTTLDNKATALASKAIRTIGYCEACGLKDYPKLQCSHVISRTYKKTKYDPRNTQCLCASCHGKYTKEPLMFAQYVNNSTVGLYVDHMHEIANDTRFKVDHEYWNDLNKKIIAQELTVFEARDILGFQYVGLRF